MRKQNNIQRILRLRLPVQGRIVLQVVVIIAVIIIA